MILWEMAQVALPERVGRARRRLEEQFRGRVRMNARAVQQAPFRVLAGANMPAVLVEIGFLTNPSEEQQLLSDAYQTIVVAGARRRHRALPRTLTRDRLRPPAPRPDRGDGRADVAARGRSSSLLVVRWPLGRGVRTWLPRWLARAEGAAGRAPKRRRRAADAQDQGDALLRVGGRPAAGAASSARCRSATARWSRRGASSKRSSQPPPAPLVSAIPPGTTLRAMYLTERGEAFVDLSPEVASAPPGRRARRAAHGILDRERADDEPARRSPACRSSWTAAKWTRWPATWTPAAAAEERC